MSRWKGLLIGAGLVILFLAVNSLSFEDALSQEDVYQQRVCAGHWPDYKNTTPVCKNI
tara:strand:+ start:264 stop:437 length:174 start_codon:yes stop_codon:yes gene_type:complete